MILMLDPDTGDEQREKIAGDVKSKLESGGEILHEANWGMRKMAYQIEKHESSEYRFFRFNGEKILLDDLDHSLKITDGVLRFRIFKSEPDAPVIVPPDTEQIMRRDEDDRERGGRREGGRGGPRRPRNEDEGGSQGSSSQPAAAPAATPAPSRPPRHLPRRLPSPRQRPSPSPPSPSQRPSRSPPTPSSAARLPAFALVAA